jgi:ATP-dependent RNA helicase SUPV3L1/SUV3
MPTETAVAVASEPELVEVWRPGGRSEERRPPRHDRNRHRPNAAQGAAQPAAEGEAGEGGKRERFGQNRPAGDRQGQGRRDRGNHEFRRPRSDAPAVASGSTDGAPNREARPNGDKGRPPRERFQGKGKGKFQGNDRGEREKGGREGRPQGDRGATRPYASSAAPRERDRAIDPNSPFAKLAALKEAMTGRKD